MECCGIVVELRKDGATMGNNIDRLLTQAQSKLSDIRIENE